MRQTAELLFANEAFYDAFRHRDATRMDALWADRHFVACIHPGWRALTTREEVIDSWRRILGNPQSPKVACRGAQASPRGDLGFVVCYEVIGNNVLAATNVFAREDGTWKLIHHQAGACDLPLAALEDEPESGSLQ